MGSRYLSDMADVLRAAGMTVIEVDRMVQNKIVAGSGWKLRGRGSGGFDGNRPWAICWHHTASRSGASAEANVAYATFYSTVAPVANLYLHRDGVWYCCAAGATNTEGKGGPWPTSRGMIPTDQGNTHFIGIEAGNDGVGESWPQVMIDSYFAGTIALQDHYGMARDDLSLHITYAPNRKIDPATGPAVQGPWKPRSTNNNGSWSLDDVIAEITRRGTPPPPPTPPPPTGDDDVRISPFLIQTTDGSGRVFCTDGQLMTYRLIANEQALAGYRWTARNQVPGIEKSYPELADGGKITAVDDLSAYGVQVS